MAAPLSKSPIRCRLRDSLELAINAAPAYQKIASRGCQADCIVATAKAAVAWVLGKLS